MKIILKFSALGLGIISTSAAFATDHNNIDAGRPLRFDDAYSIAFHERSLEFGFGASAFQRRSTQYEFRTEFKYGFAPNRDFSVSFAPTVGGGTNSSSNRLNANNIELSYFQGFQRETQSSPALALRVDAGLPTGTGARGVDLRMRGILTKTINQYDRFHVNVDFNLATQPISGQRRSSVDAIFGYSKPNGYPTKFDQTMVAEFALTQGKANGQGYTGTLGVGFRRQVSIRSVFDIGLESDLFSPTGGIKSPIRAVVGYSIGF